MKKKILFSFLLGVAILSMSVTPIVFAQKVLVNPQAMSPQITALEPVDQFAPGVTDLLGQGANPVQLIIQTTSSDYTQISNLVKSLGGSVTIEYQTINAIAVTIPANNLFMLAASPDIVKIYSDSLRYLQESIEPVTRDIPTDIVMGYDPEMTITPIDIETLNTVPSTYANPDLTSADQIWFDPDVNFGAGVKVAIIDTGCWHTEWEDPYGGIQRPWYWGNVYDGIDLSYDVDTIYEGYDNPLNHYHGTVCAALLAAHAEIIFSPNHLWADSILYYYPDAGYYEEDIYTVSQSGSTYMVDLIETPESAVDFYDYSSASGHTPFMEDHVSKVYLYKDTLTGELSLIMHHSIDNSESGNMRVDFNLEGVPEGAYTALSDDPVHAWNATRPGGREFDLTLEPEGNWYHGSNSDGGVIGGLTTDEHWAITIEPNFITPDSLTDWQYQIDSDSYIELDMTKPITISRTNRAHIFAFGIAPAASIYPVKVFDHTGGGVPSSLVMQGIEAAMLEGVDVISMSLGGGVGAPGADPEDLLVDAATAMGITVVAAAGNEGPAPLRVGSPGTARTSITVGAAIDPIHHKVAGGILFGHPFFGNYYYPSNEKSIAYFSSRGPTSDGRMKPDVVATGYWIFAGYPPSRWPYTITIAGGTSFSCPQVAGEAALLTAYIRNNGLSLGPKSIKKAIMEGADPIDGFADFEQGTGYINCQNSLKILKSMGNKDWYKCKYKYPNYGHRYSWHPPIDTLRLKSGKSIINDVTIDPAKFEYFAFWVDTQVDSIRITLSGVEFAAPVDQNPLFGDSGYIYLSSAIRDGIEDYLMIGDYWDAGVTEFIYQVSSDFSFQPGVVRLVFEGDWWSYNPIHIDQITIEVVEVSGLKCDSKVGIFNSGVDVDVAQVSLHDGTIFTEYGKVKEGEYDLYAFTIPDEFGLAFIELSWRRDWAHWGTSDLDILIFDHEGHLINVDGATGASPEVAIISGAGDYFIMVDGYQVYWDKKENYCLEIIYIADVFPKWESDFLALVSHWTCVKLPKKMHGVAVIWIFDTLFGYWYIADFVKV